MTTGSRGVEAGDGAPSTSILPPFDESMARSRTGPTRAQVILLVGLLLAALVAGGGLFLWRSHRLLPPVQVVPTGAPAPVRTWPSGVWTGGTWGAERVAAFAQWRGSPIDTAITYPAYDTWQQMSEQSDWHVAVFDGFRGTLVYGLPLLPKDSAGHGLDEVARGDHDAVFTAVAATLRKHGRGDSYIRVGLEAQGAWFPWGVNNGGNTAAGFKAAFVHVARLLRAELPKAKIVFDTSCGAPLRGQSNRMDLLTTLYPGDDVVDVVGCDHYDQYQLIGHNEKQFTKALTPDKAAGLQDTLDFARAHGKRFAVPEWGVAASSKSGGGDNDYFVYAMYMWFAANAKDIAFENYFNEPDATLGSSIWDQVQNPKSSMEYKKLWGLTARPATPSASG
ncbi:MAG: glycosyl hydrolase [Kineosporiaceae bacterium]